MFQNSKQLISKLKEELNKENEIQEKPELLLSPNFKQANQKRQNLRKERFKKIERQINLEIINSKKKYNTHGIQPFSYFWKYLLINEKESTKLIVNIPDTIVLNDNDVIAFWIFTNDKGEVQKNDNFSSKEIVDLLGNYGHADELIAVSKKPHYNAQGNLVGNDIKLLSTKELSFWSKGFIIGKKGGSFILSRNYFSLIFSNFLKE